MIAASTHGIHMSSCSCTSSVFVLTASLIKTVSAPLQSCVSDSAVLVYGIYLGVVYARRLVRLLD